MTARRSQFLIATIVGVLLLMTFASLELVVPYCARYKCPSGTEFLLVAVLTGVARHNRVYVQLDDTQEANLMLPGRCEPLPLSGVANRLWRVHAPAEQAPEGSR